MPKALIENIPRTLWWEGDTGDGHPGLMVVDQTRLPLRGDVLCCNTIEGVILSIKSLAVRGAPALGCAAAFGLALWSFNESEDDDAQAFLWHLEQQAEDIAKARPTAVNLSLGARRALQAAKDAVAAGAGLEQAKQAVLDCAQEMLASDEAANRALGAHGSELLKADSAVMTICNAGSLATAYYGTALGVIYSAMDQGKIDRVWVCETRPANQGGRLTALELMMAGIPSLLIADSAAASIMAKGWVDAVITGADRICANGDTANKIGTYMLAVLAHEHGIPFYIAAPTTTIDWECAEGADITIEQRDPRELEGITVSGIIEPDAPEVTQALDLLTQAGVRELKLQNGHQMQVERQGGAYAFDAWFRTTPPNVQVYNPVFDVTPARLITGIITEKGVVAPEDLRQLAD